MSPFLRSIVSIVVVIVTTLMFMLMSGCAGSVSQRYVKYAEDGTTDVEVVNDRGAEIASVKDAKNEADVNAQLRRNSREHGMRQIEERARARQLQDAETAAIALRQAGNVNPTTNETLYPILVRNHSSYARTVYVWPNNGLDDPPVYELDVPGSAERRLDLPAGEYTFKVTKNGGGEEMLFRWRDKAGVQHETYRPTFATAPTSVILVNGVEYYRDIHLPR